MSSSEDLIIFDKIHPNLMGLLSKTYGHQYAFEGDEENLIVEKSIVE